LTRAAIEAAGALKAALAVRGEDFAAAEGNPAVAVGKRRAAQTARPAARITVPVFTSQPLRQREPRSRNKRPAQLIRHAGFGCGAASDIFSHFRRNRRACMPEPPLLPSGGLKPV
jgi:hypothetical protein